MKVKLTPHQRTEREAKALIRSHLVRSMDSILRALTTIDHHGLGERLEFDVIAAMSHLDQVEKLNNPHTTY